jgi:hypothetical protein
VAAGIFPSDETGALDKVSIDYFDGNLDDSHRWVTDEEKQGGFIHEKNISEIACKSDSHVEAF